MQRGRRIVLSDGTSIDVFPAPLGKRVFALTVDYAILGAVTYASFIVLALVFGGLAALFSKTIAHIAEGFEGTGQAAILVLILVAVVLLMSLALMHGYFIYFEYRKGSTPGKKMFGLQVISADGGPLTLRQCVLRELFRSLLEVPLVVPGLISVLVTGGRRRIGDLVAGTMVVHSRHIEQMQESTFLPQEFYADFLGKLAPQALEEREAREFLRYCTARFLNGESQGADNELAAWAQALRRQVSAEASGVDDQSLVLFYAEFLHRTLKQEHS